MGTPRGRLQVPPGIVLAPGKIHPGANEVLVGHHRMGDDKLILIYRSAKLIKKMRPDSTGVRRRCTIHQITERMVFGKPRWNEDGDDYVWTFDKQSRRVIPNT